MGADMRLWRRDPLPDSVSALLDTLAADGVRISTMISVPSMVLATRTETARLLQVRAIDGGWPFYGEPSSAPPLWPPPSGFAGAFVDPAVLIQLGVDVGDTVLIGESRVPIAGVVEDFPADLGFQTAIGPRVFIRHQTLEAAGLLGFGSLTRYEIFLATLDEDRPEAIREAHGEVLRASGTGFTTAQRSAENLTEGLQGLSRFLGIVGLAALLLGGVGVASAIHVFVSSKLTSLAVLRCLGATRGEVVWAYLVQAFLLGLLGSALGVAVGLGLQWSLPRLLADLLPLQISNQLSLSAVVLGLAVGTWTTVAFALGPLLPLRRVAPLRALRRDFEEEDPPRDPLVISARVTIAVSVVLLSVLEAPTALQGLVIAAGLGAVVTILWASATVSTRLVRRYLPQRASFAVRQGISNLFRPRNQTVPVVLALGFGVFVVGTLAEVERNLAEGFTLAVGDGASNVLLFDIQSDQRSAVEQLVEDFSVGRSESTPMIPARISALDGVPAAELMADTSDAAPGRWALRREYRNSYRAILRDSETLVAGTWWDDVEPDQMARPAVSVEEGLAESLGISVGSSITWNLGGRELETVVRSIREVDWARFEPNFYVLFEPGVADRAPQTWVTLARVEPEQRRAELQRAVATTFTNVSVLDLARVQSALDTIVGTARQVLRFLSLFATLAGVTILAGAVAVTRSQRMREAAVLKTLGARRSLVLRVLVVEYLALGGLAVAGALILAVACAWAMVTWVFEMDFSLHLIPAVGLAVAVTGLALGAGLVGSRGILGQPPLKALRMLSE